MSSASHPRTWGLTLAKLLTALAVLSFLVLELLVPRGITVSWGGYAVLFGPVVRLTVAGLTCWVICRLRGVYISIGYVLVLVAILGGMWHTTWWELRLRWWEVLH